MGEGHPDHGLGVGLGDGARRGDRSHGPSQDERADHYPLVGGGVDPHDPGYLAIEHQRRVHVDVSHDHAVPVDELGAEHDANHLDRVLGPFGGGDRAEQRLG